jgi:Sec-independent protein translocase protein TatA
MGETFLDERKFLPPPPPSPIHILMQGMQESKQTMTNMQKTQKEKLSRKNKTPQKKPLQKSQQAQQTQLSISPMS